MSMLRFDVIWLLQDKPDRESDKRLAEHITYVHKEGAQPEIVGMKPLDMATVRLTSVQCWQDGERAFFTPEYDYLVRDLGLDPDKSFYLHLSFMFEDKY